jgi:hypothetical protein
VCAGYQFAEAYTTRGPRRGNVANAFMAAPPGHPFVAFAIGRLRGAAKRGLLYATGPYFLSSALQAFLAAHGNASAIVIHPMPRIYASQWNKKNPCGRGDNADTLARCAAALPNTVITTFWTNRETWKRKLLKRKSPRKAKVSLSAHKI